MKFLLSHGLDKNAVDKNGWTPLTTAAHYGHLEMVWVLLSRGVNAEIASEIGYTALHYASYKGFDDIVKALLSYIVDVNAVNKEYWTALHLALTITKDGRTVLHLAAAKDCHRVIVALISRGAPLDVGDRSGDTPLHVACKYRHHAVVELLLENNCDPNGENKASQTPLMKCLQWKAGTKDFECILEIAYLLMTHGAVYERVEGDFPLPKHTHDDANSIMACVLHWSTEQRRGKQQLTRVPSETFARGSTAVMTYLRELYASKEPELITRHKVCVVGSSKAGKTSLIKSITSSNPTLVEENDRTIGVDLFHLEFERHALQEDRPRTHSITFWDFAGQDEYHGAYSLFFSRTMYLLCVDVKAFDQVAQDSRLCDDEDEAEALLDEFVRDRVWRWFRLIFTHRPDAQVVIVATKAEALGNNCSSRLNDLRHKLFQILGDYKVAFVREMRREITALRATTNGTTRQRADYLEELRLSLDNALPTSWTVLKILDQDSIQPARYAIQKAIVADGQGFLMPDKYTRVLDEIKKLRKAAFRQSTTARIRQTFVPFPTLQQKLMRSIPDLAGADCKSILETLHDLGDVLWYSRDGLSELGDTVILDPELLVDLIRQIGCHAPVKVPKSMPSSHYQEFITDVQTHGRVAHDLLRTFSLWKRLEYPDQMLQFKCLLERFQLAYPVDSIMMHADSDIIVPSYWRVRENSRGQSEFEPLWARIEGCNPSTVTHFHWEYDFHFEMVESVFEQLAVRSYRVFRNREAHHRRVESVPNADFAVRIALRTRGYGSHMRQVIRLEAAANENAVASDLLRSLYFAMEDVLRECPGVFVTRLAVAPGRRERTEKVIETFTSAAPAMQDVMRRAMDWFPEGAIEWFSQDDSPPRSMKTKSRDPGDEIYRVHRPQESVNDGVRDICDKVDALNEKLTNLHAGAGNHRDLPGLWMVELVKTPKTKLIVWILSEISGRCFHRPIEIDVSPKFLAEYGKELVIGLIVLASVVFNGGIPALVLLKQTVWKAAPALSQRVDKASRLHIMIAEMDLDDDMVVIPTINNVKPAHSYSLLNRILTEHDSNFDIASVSSLTNLECAMLSNGTYQWAHEDDHHARDHQLRVNPVNPCVASNPLSNGTLDCVPTCDKPTFYLCSFVVEECFNMQSVYCSWDLVKGDACVESNETMQNPHHDPKKQLLWLQAFVLSSVRSVADLEDMELRVTLKRPSRLPLQKDRILDWGCIRLGNLVEELAAEPTEPCHLVIPMTKQEGTVVSGFCFHDPIEIDMSSTFLRDYGEYIQAGLSVVAHAIFGFSGTFIVKKTIIGVRDVLGNRIDRAIRMHSIAEGLELVGDLSNLRKCALRVTLKRSGRVFKDKTLGRGTSRFYEVVHSPPDNAEATGHSHKSWCLRIPLGEHTKAEMRSGRSRLDTIDPLAVFKTIYTLMAWSAEYEASPDAFQFEDKELQAEAATLRLCIQHWSTERHNKKQILTSVPSEVFYQGTFAVRRYLSEVNT
ncbi:hypothetical protein Poli38472_004505 [Pythium oligandrum]|uniref:Non-specific serine/threonine protein kinase n=1 Tax=Pythium oligandrum TaxID=41045 RepID=A0A8K1CA18_PYTOL|nr:hypothetical protein Poli38472_004505 [Pythium oligandrum]|eukprot:TMW59436.1 hypothetical protein Poli38472_004505 [Pythium oligandrum]